MQPGSSPGRRAGPANSWQLRHWPQASPSARGALHSRRCASASATSRLPMSAGPASSSAWPSRPSPARCSAASKTSCCQGARLIAAHPASRRAARGDFDAHGVRRLRRVDRRGSARARPPRGQDRPRARARRIPRARTRCGRARRRANGRAPGPTSTPTSSRKVRSGLSPAAQRSSSAMRAAVDAAAAALVGEAGIGEAVGEHRGAARQRRRDEFAHQLRARGEHQQQFGLGAQRPRRIQQQLADRLAAGRAARLARQHDLEAARRPARRASPSSTVDLPAPSPPSIEISSPRRADAISASTGTCAPRRCARRGGGEMMRRRRRWRRSTARCPPAGCATACSAGLPGIAIGVGGRPARV